MLSFGCFSLLMGSAHFATALKKREAALSKD
jgi:hypothetical protein